MSMGYTHCHHHNPPIHPHPPTYYIHLNPPQHTIFSSNLSETLVFVLVYNRRHPKHQDQNPHLTHSSSCFYNCSLPCHSQNLNPIPNLSLNPNPICFFFFFLFLLLFIDMDLSAELFCDVDAVFLRFCGGSDSSSSSSS
eukprot:959367_1